MWIHCVIFMQTHSLKTFLSSAASECVQQLLQPGLRCSCHPGVSWVQRSVKSVLMSFFLTLFISHYVLLVPVNALHSTEREQNWITYLKGQIQSIHACKIEIDFLIRSVCVCCFVKYVMYSASLPLWLCLSRGQPRKV